MSAMQRVLLINPTITGKRHARFPLAVLSLASAVRGRHEPRILDGNNCLVRKCCDQLDLLISKLLDPRAI